MGYIVGLLCMFIAYYTYKLYKNVYNPACFFSIIWCVVSILSQMKLFGFTGADTYCYILIGIGIISFSTGASALLNKGKSISFKIKGNRLKRTIDRVNTKMLWVMLIIVFVYTCSKFFLALPYILMDNTLGYVRTIYLNVGGGITANALDYLINTFIITGLRLTCEIIIINELISGRKINKFMVSILILIIVMNILLSGGRMILFDLCTYAFLAIQLNGFRMSFKLNNKQKAIIYLVGGAAVYAMIYITMDRQSNITVIESVYGNFIGGVSLFNTIVNDVLGQKWTWGTMFVYAVLSIVWVPLNYLFKIPYPKTFETYSLLVSPFYTVGKTTMNAYTTCWAFFYADFRILGIIILSAIFGIIAANSYNKYIRTRSAVDTCKYLLVLNVLVYSIIRWQFCNSSYLLALILIPLVYKRDASKEISL